MNQLNYETSEKISLRESVSYAEGSIVSRVILKNNSGNITLFAFDKGQNLSEHTAPFDALVQVIEGVANINIDKAVHTLREGEIIIMPANIPHSVEAIDKFKMLLSMIKG